MTITRIILFTLVIVKITSVTTFYDNADDCEVAIVIPSDDYKDETKEITQNKEPGLRVPCNVYQKLLLETQINKTLTLKCNHEVPDTSGLDKHVDHNSESESPLDLDPLDKASQLEELTFFGDKNVNGHYGDVTENYNSTNPKMLMSLTTTPKNLVNNSQIVKIDQSFQNNNLLPYAYLNNEEDIKLLLSYDDDDDDDDNDDDNEEFQNEDHIPLQSEYGNTYFATVDLSKVKAKLGQFPYQVSIMNEYGHFCGGAILSERYVVTAAHCVCSLRKDLSYYKLAVGVLNPEMAEKLYDVDEVKVHPSFDYHTLRDDIALIKTSERFIFDSNVKSITLLTPGTILKKRVTYSGWSTPNKVDRCYEFPRLDDLVSITVDVTSKKRCTRRTKKMDDGITIDGVLCVIDLSGHSKPGKYLAGRPDGGAPLVQEGKLIGVFSYGYSCIYSYKNEAAVFTSTQSHYDWIREEASL